jgi:hypothetical protein
VEGAATNVRPESSSKWARLDDVVSRFSLQCTELTGCIFHNVLLQQIVLALDSFMDK